MKPLARVCLFPSVLIVVWLRVSAAPGCGPCDRAQCAPLPAQGCAAGILRDACDCCSVCAAAEGQPCSSGRRPTAGRCGSGLVCVRTHKDKKNKTGVCACKSNDNVCGTDGLTYGSGCELSSASRTAQHQGKQPINIQNKGRCPTEPGPVATEQHLGQTAPIIVTAPGEIYNVTGSQVYLSCEAVGVPTPVLTWKKVLSGKKTELLPGDRGNLAIQMRGGPEKHEVTGWVLISPLTKEEEGSYECHAANSQGQASSVGAIYLVESLDDMMMKTVTKEEEL